MSGPTSRETSPDLDTDPLPVYETLQQQRRRGRGLASSSSDLGASNSLLSSSLSSLLRVPSTLSRNSNWAFDSSAATSKTSTLTSTKINHRVHKNDDKNFVMFFSINSKKLSKYFVWLLICS